MRSFLVVYMNAGHPFADEIHREGIINEATYLNLIAARAVGCKTVQPLLFDAAWKGDVLMVEAVLQHGADPNQAKKGWGWTALMYSAKNGHEQVCS